MASNLYSRDGSEGAVAGIHARLDDLADRLDDLSKGRVAPASEGRDLTGALRALERRLNVSTRGASPKSVQPASAKRGWNGDLDQAIAQISDRQRELDEDLPGQEAAPFPDVQWRSGAHDLEGLQSHLQELSGELRNLRDRGTFTDAIAELREELSAIRKAVTAAAPREMMEMLHADVATLVQRADEARHTSDDAQRLEAIDQRLQTLQDILDALSPAENLAGLRDELRAVDRKLDQVAIHRDDAGLESLQLQIAELRDMAAHAATGEAMVALAEEVQRISARLQSAGQADSQQLVAALDDRFRELAAELGRTMPSADGGPHRASEQISAMVGALSEKLDRADLAGSPILEAMATQLSRLAERMEASDARLGSLDTLERGLGALLDEFENLRASAMSTAQRAASEAVRDVARTSKVAPLEFEVIKQDIEGLRDLHAESERRTQHTLEGVHNTLVRLVDRVAALDPSGSPMAVASGIGLAMPVSGMHPATEFGSSRALLGAQPAANGMQERRPIDPSLPADHPLEPGSATSGRPSAGERIAASEAALASLKPAAAPEGDARANFIAAARRAAQAAARVSAGVPEGSDEEPQARRGLAAVAQRLSRRRPLMLGCALIVLAGTLHLVLNVVGVNEPDLAKLTSGEAPREKPKATVVKLPAQSSVASTSPTNAKPTKDTSAEPAPSALPSQPAQEAGPTVFPQQESRAIPAVSPLTVASIQLPGIADVTGSVSRATGTARSASASSEAAATNGMLPAGFSEGLKLAASQGNPAAAYEVAIRYAEGRGVQANLEEAVRWLDRAAAQGVAPAQYRLGSMYEKGQGVKKDLEQARKLYRAAADKGSAKAMHNLAVLYAEGIDGKPDFAAAGQWFRKAAERGVSDSQYNLGILYARGLGVEQNLPESYKWLALASQKNDADAGRKRDDIASRLDLPSLAAAKAAAEAFRPEPQPEEATTVAAPPGGWDAAIAPSAKAKTATQPRRIIAQ